MITNKQILAVALQQLPLFWIVAYWKNYQLHRARKRRDLHWPPWWAVLLERCQKNRLEIIHVMCFNLQVLHLCGNLGLTFKESSPVCFQMIPFLTIFTTAMLKYQGKVSKVHGEEGWIRGCKYADSRLFFSKSVNPPIFLFKSETTATSRNRSVTVQKIKW